MHSSHCRYVYLPSVNKSDWLRNSSEVVPITFAVHHTSLTPAAAYRVCIVERQTFIAFEICVVSAVVIVVAVRFRTWATLTVWIIWNSSVIKSSIRGHHPSPSPLGGVVLWPTEARNNLCAFIIERDKAQCKKRNEGNKTKLCKEKEKLKTNVADADDTNWIG